MSEAPSLPSRNTVLVVDDSADNLTLISGLLKGEYRVKAAKDGEAALKIVAAEPPDLILLDIMMPGIDGYEVCRRLKADATTREIPVIFLTAVTSSEGEIEGFETGAVDYITKPFNPLLVKARVATHLALRQAHQRLELAKQQLEAERDFVAGIVNRMRKTDGFCAEGLRMLVTPVEAANGDILLSAKTADGRRWVAVGDMTGHGLRAAIACPLVTYLFYRAARESWPAERLLEEFSEVLNEKLPVGNYMATTLIEIAGDRRSCRIWNAGLPDCMLRHADGRLHSVASTGLPLGIVADPAMLPPASLIALEGGERFYVFTDGVTEIRDPAGGLLEIEGVRGFLAAFDPARQSLEHFERFLGEFRAGSAFDDDLTFIELAI